MSDQTLDLSNVINVTIVDVLAGLGLPNINTVALFTEDVPVTGWTMGQAYKKYTNSSAVAADFGTSSNTFKLVAAVFAQQPNLLTTNGYVVVIPLLTNIVIAARATIQELTFTAKTTGTGGNAITIAYTTGAVKGAEVVTVSGSAISVQIASGSSIAAEIKAAIDAYGAAAALVSVALISGHETDTQVAVSATHLAGGSASGLEKVEDAIVRTTGSVYFFGVLIDQLLSGGDLANLAAYVQSVDKLLFYSSSDHDDFAPGGALDLIRSGSLNHTRCGTYTGANAIDTQRHAASRAGRLLSVDFTAQNSTITMNLKTLAGITPDTTIDQTALDAAKAAGVQTYVSISGDPGVQEAGLNAFDDEIYNEFWFKFALQTAGYNFLKQNGKIAQTDKGVGDILNVFRGICDQGIKNGFLAPGNEWTSDTVFGNPATLRDNVLNKGYYVWAPSVTTQSDADRQARRAPTAQIAIKPAGAVHTANVIVNVNI